MSKEAVINEYKNMYISHIQEIIKKPIAKRSITGVFYNSDSYDSDGYKRLFILDNNNRLAEVISHKSGESTFDTYKIIYKYEYVNHFPYYIKVTNIDKSNSTLILSKATLKK